MKEKIQDMVTRVVQGRHRKCARYGKAEQATAQTHGEKEAAKEREKAREAEAKAELHGEKAEHREEAALRHGVGHVPLTGPHHHRPVGMGAAKGTYPTTGTHPTTDKYL
ncbi:hypothetical protein LUZ62_024141 [Rhynchospora pubera]|uniref:Uncharacterized protein n=1 Tax=Rhynchospora pubera TaxID=906938 RepID=A0AAV8H6K9_9POAL|nr:hypothetical protein LUZ62_024141 [Rhynchospora pubera]